MEKGTSDYPVVLDQSEDKTVLSFPYFEMFLQGLCSVVAQYEIHKYSNDLFVKVNYLSIIEILTMFN